MKTGIADAIASKLSGISGDYAAVAETIENNVRSKIIKEHLNDPSFFEKMSKLLDEVITARKAAAIEYEEYLMQIAELIKQLEAGQSPGVPSNIDTPGKRALWNNLAQDEELALRIYAAVIEERPDGWRGVQAKEQIVKNALFGVCRTGVCLRNVVCTREAINLQIFEQKPGHD